MYKAGLWNKETFLEIIDQSSSSVGFQVQECYEREKNDLVKTVTMSGILKETGKNYIDILKIDIEGSEYEVFDKTCLEWIDKVKVLIIELHDRIKPGCSDRVFEVMKEHGFTYEKKGENFVFRT